jgi:co-chaperonin GroES (HSP10)
MLKYRITAVVPVGLHVLVAPLEHAAPEGSLIDRVVVSDEAPSIGLVLNMGKGANHPVHGKFITPGEAYTVYDVDAEHSTPFGLTRQSYAPGTVVLYKKYSGTEITVKDEVFLILTPDDIIGAVTGKFEDEELLARYTGAAAPIIGEAQ